MTTALELDVLPDAWEAVKAYGTTAVFTLYPNESTDEVESTVALGTPVTHTVRITPPDELSAELAEDGSQVEGAGLKFDLFTGALTPEEIAFVPAIGQRITIGGQPYRVRKLNAERSGDHIVYYTVEARA